MDDDGRGWGLQLGRRFGRHWQNSRWEIRGTRQWKRSEPERMNLLWTWDRELTVSKTDCGGGMRVKEELRLDLRTCAWDRRRGHRAPSFPAGLPRREGRWDTLMPNSWVPGSRDLEPHLAVDWMKSLTLGYKLNPGTKTPARVFPGGPVLETPRFQCGRCKFDP